MINIKITLESGQVIELTTEEAQALLATLKSIFERKPGKRVRKNKKDDLQEVVDDNYPQAPAE